MSRGTRSLSVLATTLLVVAVIGCAQPEAPAEESAAATPTYAAGTQVVTADGQSLGEVALDSQCEAEAQDRLREGMALLHNMTYAGAHASFEAAAAADAECALAYWGMAMTYVHPLWPDVVPAERLAAGLDHLESARGAAHRSAADDAYIEALAAYYGEGEGVAEGDRLAAFMEGWREAHEAFPSDPEAALFYALATIATADPADTTLEKQRRGGALAQQVLADLPNHPGAHHYVIHAYDLPALATEALPVARSYGAVSPENSHALHMTSHIFTRLGLWPESIDFNRRAEQAARERLPSGAISMHRLHAYDYLAYAHLQRGDDEAARTVLSEVESLEPPYQSHAGTVYAFAAVPVRLLLERQRWEAAAGLPERSPADLAWDSFPHLEAITVFARGLGAARTGSSEAAEQAIALLGELEQGAAALPGAYDWGIQVTIQKAGVEAWLAYEQGDTERGLERMAEAAGMEASTEKNPVTPGEVLPARELYGDMLLAEERFAEALAEYEGALARSPNRLNSLVGAARAAAGAGDREAAVGYYRRLLEVAPEPTGEAELFDEARAAVAAA